MGSLLNKNSSQTRKRIENHTFEDEEGDEYEPSAFGGFGDYFRRKKIKLQNLDADMRASAEDKPQIFKGVVAHVMGYTQPSLHVLHRDLVQHGAGFLQYLDSKTMATHIIASALPPKKSVDYGRYRIVKPAWVVDSIRAGKLLPWSDYRVVDEGPRQKVLKFGDGGLQTQTTPKKVGYREQTGVSFYTDQFKTPSAGAITPQTVTPRSRDSLIVTPTVESPCATAPAADESFSGGIDDSFFDDLNVEIPIQKSEPDGTGPGTSPSPAVPEPQGGRKTTGASDNPDPKSPEPMTSEEHNAWLLSDPRVRKSSTANPDFLKQFYSESRLHHLSTWKAELKSKMQRLAKEKGATGKPAKRKPGSRGYVLHVDFDSFFCAVSLKKHPEYIEKPAVVAHSTGTGSEIASCNYPSRKFGVKNGMWMKRATELCPDLKVLPYDFPAYEEASRLFYESILEIGGIVQSVSVDEALLDVTTTVYNAVGSNGIGVDEGSIWREQAEADKIASDLRERIKIKTGCAVSVGIGSNILQAKVALRKAKPAGQHQLKPETVVDTIGELEVKDLPGVAYSISGKLEEIGVKFVKDIRQISKEKLSSTLGPKTGEKLWEYARGIDRTEVGEQPPRKSVSAEVNWGIRFLNQPEAEEFIMNLCKELERRLVNEQVKGRQLTMKIMRRSLDAPLDPAKHLGHGKCDLFNKSAVFGVATCNAETIGKESVSILRSFRFSPGDLRGLGVQMTKLEPIKAGSSSFDSSQKRLAFPTFNAPQSAKTPKRDAIYDVAAEHVGDSSSAKKAKMEDIDESDSPQKTRPSSRVDLAQDPIADDPLTPRKPKSTPVHPALTIARAGEQDAKATPLNVAGTQFIMPTNPDPAVIAELPSDIRAKLQGGQRAQSLLRQASPSEGRRSRSESPAVLEEPLPSQVDPEVFNALPDEMKAEVLATYGRKPRPTAAQNAQQSPRRGGGTAAPQARNRTPTKRGGIRGMLNRTRERQADAAANRMQTSFVANGTGERGGAGEDGEPDELDPAFLAELPEDVRREVIEDHRRKRLAQKSGLNFHAPVGNNRRLHQRADEPSSGPSGQAKIQFPAPPREIAFTGTSLTSVEDVKGMLETWHQQSKEQGPHDADVSVLSTYLAKVVIEEKDMGKVVKLVQWLQFLVDAEAAAHGPGTRAWRKAVEKVKQGVQDAVRERGLGPIKF